MPTVTAAVFPDTMTITAETNTQGSGGGQIKGGTSNAYTNIPVAYKPLSSGQRAQYADKLVSSEGYQLTMPTHYNNSGTPTRINLDPKTHSLIVNARGDEPAKSFRIIVVGDKQGVVFEVIADKEN